MKALVRSLLPLLLGLLASCSVYENIVHPHRLPTPDLMSKTAKAKFKASEKARHKGQVLKSEEPVTSATDPNAAAGTEAKKDNKVSYSELPEGTKAKYDKQGLLKGKANLKRLQYHRYDTRPLTPNDVNRENRKLRKHPKGKGSGKEKDSDVGMPAPRSRPDAPADDSPAPAPPKPEKVKEPKPEKVKAPKEEKVKEPKPEKVKAPKEEKVKEPKEKKSKKAPIPKPDPTVEPGHN